MADTSVHHIAEKWVVQHGLQSLFPGVTFTEKKLKLRWGGFFAFDAVNTDGTIVGSVSTSSARTATGKAAIAKYQKLKADALYLLHVEGASRCLMIFTELDMKKHFEKEKQSGRFPPEIELLHIDLPKDIYLLVLQSRHNASMETSPKAKG